MPNKNKQAFTLVEMIVVITILAILGTLVVVAYAGFASESRDTTRLAEIKNIEKLLEVKTSLSKALPMPDNKVDITLNGKVVRYQGYAGTGVFKDIGFFDGGIDPKDETYYTYTINADLSKFQLMGFFEGSDIIVFDDLFLRITNASLIERYPKVFFKDLGIIIDGVTKEPLQITGTGLDILTATDTYELYINNSGSLMGTGVVLAGLLENANCERIKYFKPRVQDGNYNINPTGNGEVSVFCDMVEDE